MRGRAPACKIATIRDSRGLGGPRTGRRPVTWGEGTMTADLRFSLLGPVRAWRGPAELDLGAPQQRSVLAALLLAEGRQVPIGALIDGLWAADPPRTAAGTIRTYVSRLRRVLGRTTGAGAGAGGRA